MGEFSAPEKIIFFTLWDKPLLQKKTSFLVQSFFRYASNLSLLDTSFQFTIQDRNFSNVNIAITGYCINVSDYSHEFMYLCTINLIQYQNYCFSIKSSQNFLLYYVRISSMYDRHTAGLLLCNTA